MDCLLWLRSPARWLTLAGLLAVLLWVVGNAAQAQTLSPDCEVLERLAGKWFGRGSVRRHALSGAEPLRCRLTNNWNDARGELSSRLDCRGVDGDVTSVGSLAAVGSEGRVEGALSVIQSLEQGIVSGRCEPDAVRLELTGRNPTTGDAVEAKAAIFLSDDDSTLIDTMEARDPESGEWFSALEVRFER